MSTLKGSTSASYNPPWYRQFWPWFIIALPATAVIAGIATLLIAAHDPDGLVADDYYKEGLAINQTLERERQAAALHLTGLLRVEHSAGRFVISLQNAQSLSQATALQLRLVHPTRPNLDETLALTPDGSGRWTAPVGALAQGRWHLHLEPDNGEWRLSGRLQLPDEQQALLQPNVN